MSEKSQANNRGWTIKGIEDNTIKMVREAAKKNGAKIGGWVNMVLKKEAAKATGDVIEDTISGALVTKKLVDVFEKKPEERSYDETVLVAMAKLLSEESKK